MFQSVKFSDFCDSFRALDRQDQFTYDAKRALFDYLEDIEDQTGQRIELDVIALCCDYVESTFDEVRQSYLLENMSDEDVAEYICENTAYVGLIGVDSILYANF